MFFGTGLLLYFILAVSLPHEDRLTQAQRPMILGVCSQVSEKYGFEIGLVRLAAVGFAVMSFGATALLYLVLFFVLRPTAPESGPREKVVGGKRPSYRH